MRLRLSHHLLLILLPVLGCAASPPKFETVRRETVTIVGYNFEKVLAKDTYGSKWRMLELRPGALPYTGDIAKLSAEDRWIEIFKVLKGTLKAECKNGIAEKPRYRADELDFKKVGQSPQHPKFVQARFMCKSGS